MNPDAISRADPDREGMRQAIAAAWTARRAVSPRPWVGAVLVADGQHPADGHVARGATEGREGRHAEVVALEAAGAAARGATLYCTLEPCAHHGRTAPCATAVIDAGVSRVVVGVEDPDPNVAGAGLAMLRGAGVEVRTGVEEDAVREQLAPYLAHRRRGRPWVVLKLAATLDGRTAAADGSSRCITSAAARRDVHGLRADSDAILVGAGTVRADDPALTVRLAVDGADSDGVPTEPSDPGGEVASQPLRVVLGRAPQGARVHPALELEGELEGVLATLGARGVLQLLVEGGASVARSFHAAGLVDRYVLYLAPAFAGGDDGRPLFAGPGAATIDDLWRGEVVSVRRVGPDLRVEVAATGVTSTEPAAAAVGA